MNYSRRLKEIFTLPLAARQERAADRRATLAVDPGIDAVIESGVHWLGRAQDHSTTHDGGVARHYSLLSGWGSSYPETTGYIVPTLLAFGRISGEREIRDRARRILDWLAKIQFPDGGFQAGPIDSTPVVPVTFNTGQILLGLAAGVEEFGDYATSMRKAADWLVDTQDADGCWRRYPTPFAAAGEKAYETHVAWGLLEAARILPDRRYGEAALANIGWALGKQRANGWVEHCCLSHADLPLTHTLGYFLRGVLEGYRYSGDIRLLEAAKLTGDGLLSALRPDGHLPGRLYSSWAPAVSWVCLTGSVQVAHSWLLLFQHTGDKRYFDGAASANQFVRRTIKVTGPPETRGAVKGSFPVDGWYGQYEYLNWAVKFCVDSQMLEKTVRARSPQCQGP